MQICSNLLISPSISQIKVIQKLFPIPVHAEAFCLGHFSQILIAKCSVYIFFSFFMFYINPICYQSVVNHNIMVEILNYCCLLPQFNYPMAPTHKSSSLEVSLGNPVLALKILAITVPGNKICHSFL